VDDALDIVEVEEVSPIVKPHGELRHCDECGSLYIVRPESWMSNFFCKVCERKFVPSLRHHF
jgi:hypothetical protein